jgi:hypothetical protein
VQVFDDRIGTAQAESGWNNLTLLGLCRMYSRELLMMGKEDARNTYSFMTELIWLISASVWLLKKKC